MNNNLSSGDIVKLLRAKYKTEKNGFNPAVILEQVPDGTGWMQSRWIDAVVFQLWDSKGLTRSAFEIKVSRQDFIRELNNPAKHQWCLEYFHQFWFVGPKDIIQLEELPKYAGWMYPRGQQLCIGKNAPMNQKPKLDDKMLAGFMRAAYKGTAEAVKRNETEILAGSTEYQRAMIYEKAVLKFLERRGEFPRFETEEELIELLSKATSDKEFLQDKKNLEDIAGRFQSDISDLALLFAVIANKSLLARDEMGKHLVQAFGGIDEHSLEALQKLTRSWPEYHGRRVEAIELLLNWDKLRAGQHSTENNRG